MTKSAPKAALVAQFNLIKTIERIRCRYQITNELISCMQSLQR